MPFSLLLALLIAFGLDAPWAERAGLSIPLRLVAIAGAVLAVGLLALGLGKWVTSRVAHLGYATNAVWRRYTRGSRLLTALGLVVYALIVHALGWGRIILSVAGFQDLFLVDDLAIFSPYILIQLLTWAGLYLAERALHPARNYPRLPSYLLLRTRQSVGLVLPVVLIFLLRQDLFARLWPDWHRSAVAEPLELAGLAVLILLASPLFVRLAWPTRTLPDGPLRRRLERVASRVGFRFSDFLVWDTGNIMVNACVTGVLPRFRYVLLTDALIESLSPVEVAAVFGHEVGHVAHRHLPFFAFFFLGSFGVMALAAQVFSISEGWIAGLTWIPAGQLGWVTDVVESVALLGSLAVFIWLIFGHLSRRFERQADVFGCKVVSCGVPECPPHFDIEDGPLEFDEIPISGHSPALCSVGIEIFSHALVSVARQNGIDLTARSWRHGSIANRLAFLAQLQTNPATQEPGFQQSVRSFRLALTAFLVTSLLLAVMTRSWELLH
jgi:STE24 endopeptidase